MRRASAIALGFLIHIGAVSASTPPANEAAPDFRTPALGPAWREAGGSILHIGSGIAFPKHVGAIDFRNTQSFSHPESGLDEAAQWYSADSGSNITAYVFRPTLADTGLLAFMIDDIVRKRYSAQLDDDRLVPLGGTAGAARQLSYVGGTLEGRPVWTGAVIAKNGTFLISIRITVPAGNRADGEKALDAMVSYIRTTHPSEHYHAIAIAPCERRSTLEARAISTTSEQDMETVVVLTMADLPEAKGPWGSRVPDRMCSAGHVAGEGSPLLLRADPAASTGRLRSRDVMLIDDAGQLIELIDGLPQNAPPRLVFHTVGEATVLGSPDGPLSDAQWAGLLRTRTPLNRVTTRYTVDGHGKINIIVPTPPK